MKINPLLLFAALSLLTAMPSRAEPLTEIVVTAELIENSLLNTPSSVSVLAESAIQARSAQHLEDLLNMTPNVNFATGASRGRFIQIRGIGERSEFQEPIINSVGVLVDGIDMTGIATAAAALDIQQVEVLRGPQGTLHGANALAGLINIVSNAPSEVRMGRIELAAEEFGGRKMSGVISGPLSDTSGYRLALMNYQSDGFVDNVFLSRDDTNDLDETSARLRYRSQPSDDLLLDLTLFYADINNGYDAFSLDNSRQTYSDQPGTDDQQTSAAAINVQYAIHDSLAFSGSVSFADSELEYGYDEDWSHIGICDGTACDSELFGFDWWYSSTDNYVRDNNNTSIDLRLTGTTSDALSWVAGLYHRDQGIELDRQYTFAAADFSSQLDSEHTALYGQVEIDLNPDWIFSGGLRLEKRDTGYNDNSGAAASPDEDLWGGRLSLSYRADSGAYYYGLISRGYKSGGFNLDQSIPAEQREFDTETMLNYEVGVKTELLEGRMQLQASLFYQDRQDVQTKQSIVRSIATGLSGDPCPCSFTDFTDNASTGSNSGIEAELAWQASDRLQINAALGLLNSRFDDYLSFEHVLADRDQGIAYNLAGREQAHAPGYQWFAAAEYALTENAYISGSLEGKDAYFFSDRHDERSQSYEMLNLELGWRADNWHIAAYAKNLTDEIVTTRGFGSFGNDPRKFYQTEPYNQFAAPRLIGLKASMEF